MPTKELRPRIERGLPNSPQNTGHAREISCIKIIHTHEKFTDDALHFILSDFSSPSSYRLNFQGSSFFVSKSYVCIFPNCSQRQSWESKLRRVTPMLATSRRTRPLPWALVCAATCHPCNSVIRPPNGSGGALLSFLRVRTP